MARKCWFPPLLLLLIAVLYYLPVLDFQHVIQGTDDMSRGWHTYGDYGHAIETWSDMWSPLNGGTVLAEQRYGSFVSPMYPLHLILPKYQQRVIEYIFWTFVAGTMMFFYLRQVALGRLLSFVCATGFMLAPALLSNIFTGHYVKMEVIALLPGIMLFTERMLKKVSVWNFIALPILISLAIYSRHVQLAYFVLLGMGFYFAFRMIHMFFFKKELALVEAFKRTGVFISALIVTVLLTSMSTFPTIHHTEVVSKRAGGVDYDYASSFALHAEEVITLLEPDFVGWRENYWGRNPLKLNTEYFGTIILLLAGMLFLFGKQTFRRYLYAGIALSALLFALGPNTPVHRIAYHALPMIKSLRAPSMMYIWVYFPAFVLAAMALKQLLTFDWGNQPVIRKRLIIYGGITGGLALIYALGAEPIAKFWYNSVLPLQYQSDRNFQSLQRHLPQLKMGGFLTFLWVAALYLLIYLKATHKIGKKAFLLLLLAVLSIDLLRVSYPFFAQKQTVRPHTFFSKQEKFEESIATFLNSRDSSHFRVYSMLGDQKLFIPGLEMTYVFEDFTDQQYNDIIERLQMTVQALAQRGSAPSAHDQFVNTLRFLNTKYILTQFALPLPGLTEMINSGGFRIYKVEQVFPRAYLAGLPQPVEDQETALFNAFSNEGFAPDFAFVDKNAPNVSIDTPEPDTTLKNDVSIVEFDNRSGHYVFDVHSDRPQMLVVADNHTPGWNATVNGTEAEVLRVNHTWKGVMVPRGESRVEMAFHSPIAQKWRRVTLVSAILFGLFSLGTIAWYGRRKFLSGKPEGNQE